MKIGDLVICKYVEGKPLGVILNVRWRKVGSRDRIRIYDVFVNAHDFFNLHEFRENVDTIFLE